MFVDAFVFQRCYDPIIWLGLVETRCSALKPKNQPPGIVEAHHGSPGLCGRRPRHPSTMTAYAINNGTSTPCRLEMSTILLRGVENSFNWTRAHC